MGRFDFNDSNNLEGLKVLKKMYDDLMENMLNNGYSEDLFNDSTKLKEMLKQFDTDAVMAIGINIDFLNKIENKHREYLNEIRENLQVANLLCKEYIDVLQKIILSKDNTIYDDAISNFIKKLSETDAKIIDLSGIKINDIKKVQDVIKQDDDIINFNFDYSSRGQFVRSFVFYFVNEMIKKITMDKTIIEFVNSKESYLSISTRDFESKYSIIINKKNEKLVKYLLENYNECFYNDSSMENYILDMRTNERHVQNRHDVWFGFNTITSKIYQQLSKYSFIIGTKIYGVSKSCYNFDTFTGCSNSSIDHFYLVKLID